MSRNGGHSRGFPHQNGFWVPAQSQYLVSPRQVWNPWPPCGKPGHGGSCGHANRDEII